jgi:hypothetical protein
MQAENGTQLSKSIPSRQNREVMSGGKMLISFVRYIFHGLKKPEHLASRTEFVGTPEQRFIKSTNPGLSRENRDEWYP